MYPATITWTSNTGSGTSSYRAYSRDHEIAFPGKSVLSGSSDAAFRGDATRYNPEEMLVAALSACHLLVYLHACASAGVVVLDYMDNAEGTMIENADGSGRFSRVLLRPVVTLGADSDLEAARHAHHTAHEKCFIANSVNFPVDVEPVFHQVEASVTT
jgi:organic hydroperoxide reductase OsmC/OhrA